MLNPTSLYGCTEPLEYRNISAPCSNREHVSSVENTVAAKVAEGRVSPWKTWVCVSRAVARACRPTPTDPTRLSGTSYRDERDFDLRSRYVRLTK